MTSKRKSIVPPAVLIAFALSSALTGIYGIIIADTYVVVLAIIWFLLGLAATALSSILFNRGT